MVGFKEQKNRDGQGPPTLCLIGPTAVGKTSLSLEIARRFSCEIISVDSMQVYRHMDIGTAKASLAERALVPHHLIDIVDPNEEYNVGRFLRDARKAMEDIRSRGKLPLLVGGTGLYLRGLLQGLCETESIDEAMRDRLRKRLESEGREALYAELQRCDPESTDRIHPNDTQRLLRALEIYQATGVPWSCSLKNQPREPLVDNVLKLGLSRDRKTLYARINDRVTEMIEQGLLAEVKNLLAMGYSPELKAMQSIGYRHMVHFIQGQWSWKQSLELLARDTRRYAKRQFTWFGGEQGVAWFEPEKVGEMTGVIETYLAGVA